MGCTAKCGSDAKLLELLLNKYIQDMIEDGRLQEGLRSCQGERLRRDREVLTCDSIEDAICLLVQEGRVCFDKPIAINHNKGTGKLELIMSNGEKLETPLQAKDTFIDGIRFNPADNTIEFTYNQDKDAVKIDISSALKVNITENDEEFVVTDKQGRPHNIPKIKVGAKKKPDGTVTITNQDGSTVDIAPVRQGDRGATGERGPKGDKGDQGERGPAGPAGTNANLPPRNVRIVNSSGKVVGGFLYSTER